MLTTEAVASGLAGDFDSEFFNLLQMPRSDPLKMYIIIITFFLADKGFSFSSADVLLWFCYSSFTLCSSLLFHSQILLVSISRFSCAFLCPLTFN